MTPVRRKMVAVEPETIVCIAFTDEDGQTHHYEAEIHTSHPRGRTGFSISLDNGDTIYIGRWHQYLERDYKHYCYEGRERMRGYVEGDDEPVVMTDGGEDVADETNKPDPGRETEKTTLEYPKREVSQLTGDTEPRIGIDALIDARYKTWFHHGDKYLFARSAGTYLNGDRRITLVADNETMYDLRIPATQGGTLDIPEAIDLDAVRETEDTAFVRAACPKTVGRNWIFDKLNSRNETFIVYAGGERRAVETDEREEVTYEYELHLRRVGDTYDVRGWSLYIDGMDGSGTRVATFDTKWEAFEFMAAKMRSHDNLPHDPAWDSADDTPGTVIGDE